MEQAFFSSAVEVLASAAVASSFAEATEDRANCVLMGGEVVVSA